LATKTFIDFGVLGLYTETSLHCGAEGGTGYVDLPIQRERHTQYPVIPGSTLKGVLRDELKDSLQEGVDALFGTDDTAQANAVPGSVSFGDGILVAFPVRSSQAPFHWVTCPFVLERVFRALAPGTPVPSPPAAGAAWAKAAGDVLLEELRLITAPEAEFFAETAESGISQLHRLLPSSPGFSYTQALFRDHLLILSDGDFKELVETATEIVTRIKLNYLGTTASLKAEDHPDVRAIDLQGNLFVEEVVPAETLFLAALRGGGDRVDDLAAVLKSRSVIRLGGDETIGRGVTRLTFVRKGV
jgi:CRISPR-associated protein Cmr4